jgi:predicted RNase H-like nuclease
VTIARSGGPQCGPTLPYQLIAGVEPCPAGWLVASAKLIGAQLAPETPQVMPRFRDVLEAIPSYNAIGAHIAIGLPSEPTRGGRTCDREARQLLGWPRRGAILSAPAKAVLQAINDYEKAQLLNGGRLDIVTFRLLPKLAEVAADVQSYHQRTVCEVQPELEFFLLNEDTPLRYSKRLVAGVAEREAILRRRLPGVERILDAELPRVRKQHLVDAAADLWAARRMLGKAVTRLPENPEWNDDGLRMEIVR